MSSITKSGDNFSAPTWFNHVRTAAAKPIVTARVEPFPSDLDDDTLVMEMDLVEKCASEGRPYFYKADWPGEAVSQLRELAIACGAKCECVKNEEVDPEFAAKEPVPEKPDAQSEADEALTKVASVVTKIPDMRDIIGDPFNLAGLEKETMTSKERKEARKAEVRAEWQKVAPEQKLRTPTAEMASNSILSVPGGDQPMTSRQVGVRRGENSIADSSAIAEFAKTLDNGERLRQEAKERDANKKAGKSAWQKELIQTAKEAGPGAMPRGSVFMTQTLNAQPGLRGEVFPTKENVPDKTAGEMLKGKAKEHKAAISRPDKDRKEWQHVQGAARHEISDVFAEELEKQLGISKSK